MTQIIVAHGLCSAIRPKVLTALPAEKYPSLKITYVGKGRYGVPGTEHIPFPDDDAWVMEHIAYIDVPGDLTFAKWVEYVLCRYMAANPRVGMRLMSAPLEPRNAKWAAKFNALPPDWRQQGCKTQPYKGGDKQSKAQPQPAKATKAGKRAKATKRSGTKRSGLNVAGWLEPLRRR